MNRRHTRIFFFMLLWLGLGSAAHGAVSASLDRTAMALDETLNLTISKEGGSFFSSPDLSPLEPDFTVIGQNQSNSTQIINGSMSSRATWHIVLAPKKVGSLHIPALTVGKEKTSPLTVQVARQAPSQEQVENLPLFLETEVDQPVVLVQSQVIYTLRIFAAINAQINDPGLPQAEEALIEKLGNATYDKVIDGTSYRVFELKYALFPQKSGVLKIPPMLVQASLPGQQRGNNFFDPFGTQRKVVRLRSKSEQVTVQEQPPVYPAGAVWLPTSKLTVADEWSRDPGDLQVGESATITIGLVGEGLLGSQLPPIELAEVDGLKLYQGKAEVQSRVNDQGITGIRQESIALIAIRPGTLHLPEIRIPWWNTATARVEYGVLPARELVVRGATESARPVPASVAPSPPPSVSQNMALDPEPGVGPQPVAWMAASGVLGLFWLITLGLLLKTRHQLAAGGGGGEHRGREIKEKEAFKTFKRACLRNDAAAARSALLAWARGAAPGERFDSLADLVQALDDDTLGDLLQEVDLLLYGQKGGRDGWQGARLLDRVTQLRQERAQKKSPRSALQPLYK